jgi:hypothetical protein
MSRSAGRASSGAEDLLLDGLAQRALQLLVERRVILAVTVQPSDPFRKHRQFRTPAQNRATAWHRDSI